MENKNLADTPSTIQNLRCNFQFNPDSITRSIEARADMQFFFNQDPSQLAQPIPGNAGFAFELLFNREAELHSKHYVGENGNSIPGHSGAGRTPEFFINQTYDPAWVTEIGVLADIMVLDDIVGQGIAKDIFKLQQSGVFVFAAPDESDTSGDEGDNEESTPKTWDSNRLSGLAQSANLGNKAFLVPTPVRIMFSPWLMIEGFVQRYSVTFNKFTPEMIPSQAIVAVQMQALYVGFAQQKTFLTDFPDLDPEDGGNNGSDIPPPGSKERDEYDRTKKALGNYVSKAAHIQGKENALDLLDCFFTNSKLEKEINFIAKASDSGKEFYEKAADSGGLYFTVKGEIKVWWDSHVSNATNSRDTFKTDANVPGTIVYTAGPPPNESGTNYSIYGTSASPFIATLDEIPVYYDQGKRSLWPDGPDLLVLGQIQVGNEVRVLWNPLGLARRWGSGAGVAKNSGTPAMWKWKLEPGSRFPFKQDKFTVSLELTLTAERLQIPVESPQKITGRWTAITADTDILFENVSPAGTSRPPGTL